jgi:hypothetical protein
MHFDFDTGLYWDPASKMFFDPGRQLYYDPAIDHYYDPTQGLWFDPSINQWGAVPGQVDESEELKYMKGQQRGNQANAGTVVQVRFEEDCGAGKS